MNRAVNYKIEEVFELNGAFLFERFSIPVYAHVSVPMERVASGIKVQYILMASSLQQGIMHLGNIDPETKRFETFDPNMMNTYAAYRVASNGVVKSISVSLSESRRLITLNEMLAIKGIRIVRKLVPNDDSKLF